MITLKNLRMQLEVVMATGPAIRGAGYVSGPDGDSPSYVETNIADYEDRSNEILKHSKAHNDLHIKKGIKEELKVGDKDDDGKYYAKKVGKKTAKSKLKRKYRGKMRGTTHTGKPAHTINTQPVIQTDLKR